jgi:hypothetical protein
MNVPAPRTSTYPSAVFDMKSLRPGRAIALLALALAFSTADSLAAPSSTTTTTTLTVSQVGYPPATLTSVASSTPIQLNASVNASAGYSISPGTVSFCDAAAASCTGNHLIGTAQLTTFGVATLRFVPSIGTHTYKAVFAGRSGAAGSTSASATLTVTGTVSASAALTATGSAGNYTLKGTVTGQSPVYPSGLLSFLDTSNSNASVASVTLAPVSSTLSLPFLAAGHAQVGSVPIVAIVADVNKDGYADVLVLNMQSSTVTILLGNGSGGFQASPATIAAGANVAAMTAGDFNGDGNLDLAITHDNPTNTVTILLGNGMGGFTLGSTLNTGNGPESIAVGDFNGDGNLDLAVGNVRTKNISIFLGTGGGTFTTGTPASLFDSPSSIAVADFNGDGVADLAVANSDLDTVSILLGTGSGTFNAVSATPSTGSTPISIAVADFNADGNADLAVANNNTAAVTILLGNGQGGFTAPAAPATAGNATSIAVGDFNGDGVPDLAVAQSGSTLTVLIGTGSGTFAPMPSPPPAYAAYGIATGALNTDGLSDVLLTDISNSTIEVYGPTGTAISSGTVTGVAIAGGGTHQVDATLPASAPYAALASSTKPLTGAALATTLTLTANPTTTASSQQVALQATLAPYSNLTNTTNTETVTFYSGTANLGTGTLTSGTASIDLTTLPVGTLSLTAVYAGDTNFATSTSSAISYTVSPTATLGQSTTATATLVFTTAGTLATIVSPQGSDFSWSGGGTCQIGTAYAAGATCTVTYQFRPSRPWMRYGGITLVDANNNVLANIYLSGLGTGPQIIYPAGNTLQLGPNVNYATGIAIDANGDLFVASSNTNIPSITEIPSGCTSYQCETLIGAGLNGPQALAFDGSGNLYIADTGNNQVKEFIAVYGQVPSNPAVVVWNGFSSPSGIAVDGSGNVYVSDSGTGRILQMQPVNGIIPANPTLNVIGTGFNNPTGLAVDNALDIYLAETGSGNVKQIPAGCTSPACVISLGGSYATSVAVNPLGDVFYISGGPYSTVYKIQAVNGVIPPSPSIRNLGYFAQPQSLALDPDGNLYVTAVFSLYEIDYQHPTALLFPATQVGKSSAASGEQIENIGNAPLNIGDVYVYPGFTSFTGANFCGSGTVLVSTQSCIFAATFTPTAPGPLSGSIQFLSNALGSVPFIPLFATGIALTPATLPAPVIEVAYNQTIAMTGGHAPYHYALTAGSMPTGLVLDPLLGTITGIPTGGGPFAFTITATDSSSSPLTVSKPDTFPVAPPTIALLSPTVGNPRIGVAFNQAFTASGGTTPYVFTATGLPTGLVLSASGVLSGTPTQAGPQTISITATDASTGSGPYSQKNTYSIVVTPPTLVLPASIPNATVGAASSQNLGMTGGTAPYTEVVSAGNLPAGLTLSPAGLLTGTPITGGGPYTFTLTATDSSTGTAAPFALSQAYTFSVTPFPVAYVSPGAVNFATIPANTTSNSWTITLNNTSGTPMLVTGFVLSDALNFAQTNNCPSVLAGYTNCNILVTFVPRAAGSFSGSLTINDSAQSNPQTVTLQGTATSSSPTVLVSPSSLTFADVPVGSTGNTQTVTISNTGATPLTIASIALTDQADFTLASSCGTTLAPYTTCNLLVAAKPQATGPISGSIIVTDNASPTTQTVTLTGNGLSNTPTVLVSPSTLTFAGVPVGSTGNSQTVTINNTGATILNLAGIALTDQTDFVVASSCGLTLAAHTTCNLLVSLKPQATGPISGSLIVTDNANPTTQTVTMTGTGLSSTPTVIVSPGSLNFSTVPVGSTGNSQTVTVSNTGATPLAISSIASSDQADFVIASSCPATLAAYTTCNVTVALKPQSGGSIHGILTVTDNASPTTQTVILTGSATAAAAPASVNILPVGGLSFPTQTVGTTSPSQQVTIYNTGTVPYLLSSAVLSDTQDYIIQSNTCPPAVGPGGNCTLNVAFAPGTPGPLPGQITLYDNTQTGTTLISLSGTAAAPPTATYYNISVNPAAVSVQVGSSATAAFTMTPSNGYKGSVALACGGLPTGVTCQFSPATLTADGTNKVQTSQLTVNTSGMLIASSQAWPGHPMLAGVSSLSGLWLVLLMFRRRKSPLLRTLRLTVPMLLLFCSLGALSGCGSGPSGVYTAVGNHNVTVTATSTATSTGAVVQTVNLTLTITQ